VNNRFLRRQDRRCLRSNAAGILASPESRFSFRFPQFVSLRSGLPLNVTVRGPRPSAVLNGASENP
jgi:hypothetical protein